MKANIILLLILILASSFRLFKLSEFPATLYGDEQAFAWNAYNILLTGQDEYGISYPLQFKSFDDYKAPIPVYILVPFIYIFGFNNFAIRLPIGIASVLTVCIVYFLLRIFFNRKISLIGTLLMALSPWHIHLSRGFFESTLSQLFFILGIYSYIKRSFSIKHVLASVLFFSLSLYSYFTPRILVPLMIIFLFLWRLGRYKTRIERVNVIKLNVLGIFALFILLIPLVKATLFEGGFSRFQNLSQSANRIVAETVQRERYGSTLPEFWKTFFHNKVLVRMRNIKDNYLEHLSINYWFIFGDNSLRYFTGNMGMFYLYELPFFIIGIYLLWKDKKNVAILFIGWILLAPIPASIVGKPFAVRSLMMLPAPFIFTAYGIYRTIQAISSRYLILISLLLSFLTILALGSLLIRYYFEYPIYAATWWGYENYAALNLANENETKYDHIFLSDFYTGMPLALAVYQKLDPIAYRTALANPIFLSDDRKLIKIGKYYIGSLDINQQRLKEKRIPQGSFYIGRPEEADSDETINAPEDGRVLFRIYRIE